MKKETKNPEHTTNRRRGSSAQALPVRTALKAGFGFGFGSDAAGHGNP